MVDLTLRGGIAPWALQYREQLQIFWREYLPTANVNLLKHWVKKCDFHYSVLCQIEFKKVENWRKIICQFKFIFSICFSICFMIGANKLLLRNIVDILSVTAAEESVLNSDNNIKHSPIFFILLSNVFRLIGPCTIRTVEVAACWSSSVILVWLEGIFLFLHFYM